MNENIFKSKEVTLTLRDGSPYTFRPLALNKLIEIWPIISRLEKMKEEQVSIEVLKDMRSLVCAALKDRYPEVTEEKAGDLVDLVDLNRIIQIVVGLNEDLLKSLIKKEEK